MSIRTERWPAGTPCWADLGTTDVDGARAFYAAVLGWDFMDTGEEFGNYLIANLDGNATAGLGQTPEGMPPAWTLYLASDDVAATAEAITANGGQVVMPVMDVGPMGRMIIAVDPTGAAFGVWQAVDMIGAAVVNQPGGLTWEDLRSTDPEAAKAFYGSVFGFGVTPMAEAGPDYGLFHTSDPEYPLGGLGGMMGAPDGTPSHWLVYFGVADAEAAVEAAEASGGEALAAPFDTPYGKMVPLRDPAGAVFWTVEMPADPA